LVFVLTLVISCGVSSDESEGPVILYYSCSGNIVIRAHQNTSQNCQISIYKGKELITGRQLLRKDSAGWNYIGGDIAASLTDSTIVVELRGEKYEDCIVSPQEQQRREYRDTIYYITNTGALIKIVPQGDSIAISMAYASNEIYSGTLPRVTSGSGEKYGDGNTMFWSKSNTAMFIHQGINYSHCIRMWPDEIQEDPCKDDALDLAVRAFLTQELANEIDLIPEQQRRYYAERYDLNDDGNDEILIALRSPYFCGTGGCTWYIAGHDNTLIGRFSVSQFPIYISTNRSNGFRDLYVSSRSKYHMLSHGEEGYPQNPSVAPEIRLFSDPAYTTAGTERILSQAYLKSCPF